MTEPTPAPAPALDASLADAVALVRLLTADLDTPPLLTDAHLARLLLLNGAAPGRDVEHNTSRLAAADALEVVARSEVLVSKKIRTADLSTDGPAVAGELRAQAAGLRAQVRADRASLVDDADDAVLTVIGVHG